MQDMLYEYEPYIGHDRQEIPCFRIYADDVVLAQTNEDLPMELQERTAQLFTHTGKLEDGLKRAIAALGAAPDFQTNEGMNNRDLAIALNAILISRKV